MSKYIGFHKNFPNKLSTALIVFKLKTNMGYSHESHAFLCRFLTCLNSYFWNKVLLSIEVTLFAADFRLQRMTKLISVPDNSPQKLKITAHLF